VGGIALTLVVGFVSGVLSGAFGIGGGLVTTPAIRLLLGAPELIAVGTPLPVIFPGSIAGAYSHLRRGSADLRAGVTLGLAGVLTSVAGAYLSRLAGGVTVMLATAALIVWASGDMVLQQLDASKRDRADAALLGDAEADPDAALAVAAAPGASATLPRLVAVGLVAGLYSGFLGLGGGFVIVPGLTRWCGVPIKRAIGTSLVAVAILAVPGTIVHAMLGHIDWGLAAWLAVGVVPGALIGAKVTEGASERHIRLAFAAMLAVVGVWLAVSEIAGLR
jgi:uncharacterized membrane protein YfcA